VIGGIRRQRVMSSGFFMVGFPTETEAEMQLTIDFALKSRCTNALFFVSVHSRGLNSTNSAPAGPAEPRST